MKLYDFELSGNCYTIRLFLNLLDVDYTAHQVNLAEGEHKTAAFLAMNPRGQVPVLQDGDFALGDSQAILVYLAEKFGRTDYYPAEITTRAQIQYWLSLAANEVARGPADARLIKLFSADIPQDTQKASDLILPIIEGRLQQSAWLVGAAPTIADIAVFPYVALAHDGDISLEAYPAIRSWIANIQALPGFVGMPGIPQPALA